MKNGKLMKYGFIVWLLSLISFLVETVAFRTQNSFYNSLQTFAFIATIGLGSIAFLIFALGVLRRLRLLTLLRRFITKTSLFIGFLVCLFGVVVVITIKTAPSRTPEVVQDAQKICNRTTPYDMPPALQRAISLVMQRYAEHNEPGLAEYQQMLNCLNIQFTDIHRTDSNTEGYFTFDTSQSSLDQQVVAVDAAFNDYDDLTAAVILSHELTHAKQYVDELAYKQTLSCIDKEVFAFKQEVAFYSYLNPEEQRSLSARVAQGNYDNPELAQLQQLVSMAHIAAVAVNGGQDRPFTQSEQGQYDALLESKIRQMIIAIPEYQQLCKL